MQHLMTALISEHSRLYLRDESESETKIFAQQQQSPVHRGKVGWLTQEDTGHAPSSGTASKTHRGKPQSTTTTAESRQTAPSPISRLEKWDNSQIEEKGKSKTEDNLDEKFEERSASDAAGSPSKQSKALPSWKCSFKGSAASVGTRGKMGGSAGDVSAAGGSNWLMNGLSSLRAHRRTTSSGERLKDSTVTLKDSTLSLKETTLSLKDSQRGSDEDSRTSVSHRALRQAHRMSAYDNVAPSSLSLPADTSAWTSSLAEPDGNDKIGRRQEEATEVTDSTNAEDDPAETNQRNVLTQLKQELKKQRASYEDCIRK